MPEYNSIKVYLKSGVARSEQKKFMDFANGKFLTSEIAGIEWEI